MELPARTVERLSKYRRILWQYKEMEEAHIFSHDLARLLHLTPAQVRRDLMLLGVSGNHRKGYQISELIELISQTIDHDEGIRLATVGMGNLGSAITRYIVQTPGKLKVVAGFDIDPSKVGTSVSGVFCFHLNVLHEVIPAKNITLAILAVPSEDASAISKMLVSSGIKGILNFTPVSLNLPAEVYVKNHDIVTSLEEIGFFTKSG